LGVAKPGEAPDQGTADAFATSWNHVGSVYTREQFLEWIAPLSPADLEGKDVLELGFGNGSLLVHAAACAPRRLVGVELGDTFAATSARLADIAKATKVELHRGDLTEVALGPFDLVYCIGVLHHLKNPEAGVGALLRHTAPGGRFHGWVYAKEGNLAVRILVEPLRRVTSRLPWWLTKWAIALPAVLPYYVYAKVLRSLARFGLRRLVEMLPLGSYALWIGERELGFFHHVAFDQLVTPQTVFIERDRVEKWLEAPEIEPGSAYLFRRNGNSWKFGGRISETSGQIKND
jgi:SAM-dependent methyltransferase